MRYVVPDYDAVYKNLQSVSNKNVRMYYVGNSQKMQEVKFQTVKKFKHCNKTADVE